MRYRRVGLPTPGFAVCVYKALTHCAKCQLALPALQPTFHCLAVRRHAAVISGALMLGLILMLWDTMPAVAATHYQSLDSISATVTAFLNKRLQRSGQQDFDVLVNRLDPRLRLANCATPLQPFLPTAGPLVGKVTIGVRCSTGKHWTVYVPAQVDIYEDILTAARPLLRGQRISSQDITVSHRKARKSAMSYFHDSKQLIGMVARRSIPVGRAFSLQVIEAPRLVKRGEIVTLVAETNTLTVRMKGKALSDGAAGDVIKVKNSTSNRVVEGVVTDTGVVKVKM